jgi:hypothetical protein
MKVRLGVVAGVVLLGLLMVVGPSSGEIRLDTGDLRYCWWWVPVRYERMPEPERSRIQVVAAAGPAVPAEWVTCVRYPLRCSNNPDLMCRSFYASIAAWSGEDPKIARWALEDVVNYVRTTHAQYGLPASGHVLSGFIVEMSKGRVVADWRDQEEMKAYCAAHGYVLPAAGTAP